jgi:hypothetical protein
VASILVADPHLGLPRTYQWNVALEQPLGPSQVVSATYVGAIGRDLLRATDLVNLNPNFPFVNVTSNSATSDYHALQLKFQRRLSRGLQGLFSYTFSHSIDIASTDAFSNYLNTPGAVANPNIDRGNSDFDIRHSFTAGFTYDVPYKGSERALRAALSGWSLDGSVLARSAPPDNLIGSLAIVASTLFYLRPNLNSGVPVELEGSGYPGGHGIQQGGVRDATRWATGQFRAQRPARPRRGASGRRSAKAIRSRRESETSFPRRIFQYPESS